MRKTKMSKRTKFREAFCDITAAFGICGILGYMLFDSIDAPGIALKLLIGGGVLIALAVLVEPSGGYEENDDDDFDDLDDWN